MIAAMTLTREQVYICNVVSARRTTAHTNRVESVRLTQLAILRPRVIVALSRPAAQTLPVRTVSRPAARVRFSTAPLAHLEPRGANSCRRSIRRTCCSLAKGKAWEDLKQVMRELGIPIPQAK